jgi:hypothetical protein
MIRHLSVKFAVAIGVLSFSLSGCVHKGPILVGVSYKAPQGIAAEAPKVIVGVSPFKDDRGKSYSVAGKRFNALNDQVNDLVVQGTVSDKVTTVLKDALAARGLKVKDVDAWDLTDAGIPADGVKLVISGEIKTLWAEATSTFANTKLNTTVALRIVVGDTEQKKIIRVLNVNSMIERQNVAFSAGFAQSTISEAVSSAINQIFNDEELKNRLK